MNKSDKATYLENNKKINHAISQIAAIEAQLPGVVIIHDLFGKVLWMSPRGLKQLGIALNELTALSPEQYYERFFNEEDSKDAVPKILGLLERNNDDECVSYFQQVRFAGIAEWQWHMCSTRIMLRDMEHLPLLTITIAFPIDAMHHMAFKASRLLEENNFLRSNFHIFARLSKREREVLTLMALGKSSAEIAETLFIALQTVETHRKNIKCKLNTSSYYEICQYARAFDLI